MSSLVDLKEDIDEMVGGWNEEEDSFEDSFEDSSEDSYNEEE